MADPLYDVLLPHIEAKKSQITSTHGSGVKGSSGSISDSPDSINYLSRLLSLSLSDLQQTEPQSLSQQSHSTHLSIQALSSRSHRSTTASSDRLSTLGSSLSSLEYSVKELRGTVPGLDEAAVEFAEDYGRKVPTTTATTTENDEDERIKPTSVASTVNQVLKARKDSMLLSRQADKLQDILELPSLLSASIGAAASSSSSSQTTNTQATSATTSASNYTASLDLHTHIRRLSILYPDSPLIASLQTQADAALHDMTADLIASLRAPRIRLPAAIRTIGWLRRVAPQLTSDQDILSLYCGNKPGTNPHQPSTFSSSYKTSLNDSTTRKTSTASEFHGGSINSGSETSRHGHSNDENDNEDIFPALFLQARLQAYTAQVAALSPLRDLADQETEKRKAATTAQTATRRPSTTTTTTNSSFTGGHQTERYLKRYIEIFREQSFSAIQMFKNIFPEDAYHDDNEHSPSQGEVGSKDDTTLRLPSVLATFPMHLVSLLMDTLQMYLPNVVDPAARESLLMQVLYAANSLGRLGADFSMMIALLDLSSQTFDSGQTMNSDEEKEPEWARIIKKHRIQAARLDALASNQAK